MDTLLLLLNQNKIMWGMSMLLLQLGARYVIADLGKSHELLLSNEISKKIIVFAMFFVATRDVLTSFILTVAYIIIIDGMLHEKRKYSILPQSLKDASVISKDDYIKAKTITDKYEKNNLKTNDTHSTAPSNTSSIIEEDINKITMYDNYISNVSLIKSS